MKRSSTSTRAEVQHKKGKLTAHERIAVLLDEDSFEEFDAFVTHRFTDPNYPLSPLAGDGVVTGWGTINGRQVYVASQDFTVLGGTLSEAHARKVCKVLDLALSNGKPIVYINDSGGARIQEGVASLAGYGNLFRRNVDASGIVPQISLIMGPCAGGAAYSPALTDFVFMVEGSSYMFVTGPDVLRQVTNEIISVDNLGGALIHTTRSSVADGAYPSDIDMLEQTRRLFDYLPLNNRDQVTPWKSACDKQVDIDCLDGVLPPHITEPYDMVRLILLLADEGDFFEIQKAFAANVIIGFIRIEGYTIGVVANQPAVLAGCLDNDASRKAARFVRFCDAFSIPILTIVDVPGFLPGSDQEHGGIIRNGAKLLYAYAEATVPLVSLITRKAYGGAYIVMASKHLGSDINYAWPSTEIAVMGAKGAAEILFRKESLDADILSRRIHAYEERFLSPRDAAERGFIDDIIEPRSTRKRIARAFSSLRDKTVERRWRKHGTIPL